MENKAAFAKQGSYIVELFTVKSEEWRERRSKFSFCKVLIPVFCFLAVRFVVFQMSTTFKVRTASLWSPGNRQNTAGRCGC